ncbi:hypothetical protein, partial [Collinsella sp. AM24-1]|uniref:hypothetical protein n=1 Tax=Collinsella sp. AM24-1 TaxID=2292031 RepID=UPI001F305C5C
RAVIELRRGEASRPPPFFCVLEANIALSVLGVLGLTLVEGIVVACGEVEPIFLFMSRSGGDQPAPGFCRHVYPDGSFAPYFQ